MQPAKPHARQLVLPVPITCQMVAPVQCHAGRTGLEKVVCPEAARQQPKLELQSPCRVVGCSMAYSFGYDGAGEAEIERQQSASFNDLIDGSEVRPRDGHEVVQSCRKVVRAPLGLVPEEREAGRRG